MITVEKIWQKIEAIHSDSGVLSWGRCSGTVALVSIMGLVTYLVLKNHTLPDLSGATAMFTAPYIASKAGSAVQSFSGTTPVAPPPPPPLMVPPVPGA